MEEWRWWWWPVRGGIFCRPDSFCRVHPLQQPSVPRLPTDPSWTPRESSPPAHTSQYSVGSLWVWRAKFALLDSTCRYRRWTRYSFSHGDSSVVVVAPWRGPRFRANFGEGDTALSIFSRNILFYSRRGARFFEMSSSRSLCLSLFFFWKVDRTLFACFGVGISCSLRWKSVARDCILTSVGRSIKRIKRSTFSGSEWASRSSSRGAKNTVPPVVEINYRHARWLNGRVSGFTLAKDFSLETDVRHRS